MADIQNNKRTSKKTEIDFGVINDSSDGGNLYIVCLWPGSGYFLSSMLVWADDEYDALENAACWCADNKPGYVISMEDTERLCEDLLADKIRDNPSKYFMLEDEKFDCMSNSELCNHLKLEHPKLYRDEMNSVTESEEFNETCLTLGCGISIYAQEYRVYEVEPEDFKDIIYEEA